MSKIMFKVFLLLFINESIGYMVKVDRKYLKNGFENTIEKYLGPLKTLKENFPNHAVELQVEFQNAVPQPTPVYIHHPVIQRRYLARKKHYTNDLSTTYPAATITRTYITTTALATSKKPDTANKPVYMMDLKKALEDLEAKYLKKNSCSDCTQKPVKSRENNLVNGEVRNIEEILQLIKKGVLIKNQLPKPNEEGLDWLQIKIPKKF